MSNKQLIHAKCDRCNHQWTTETWNVVDEACDQEAVQMICDDVFFIHCCPNCNKMFYYKEPLVYYNKKKNAMICFVEGITNISMTNAFMQDIIQQMDIDPSIFHIRITTTMNDFREKVMLLRDGLDDRVIEVMKLFGLDIIREEGYEQEFYETRCAINQENGKLAIDFLGQHPRNIQFDMEVYERFFSNLKTGLENEKPSFEINADWAINFMEKNS